MAAEFADPPGQVVAPESLQLPRAQVLARLLRSNVLPFAQFVESRRNDGQPLSEIIVLDVEPERGQLRVIDIDRVERIAVTFTEPDDIAPEIWALRKDFPKSPHQNLRSYELPRSLCLYAESWDEVKLRWAPGPFVERIRYWLSQTAKGELHQNDQPLEPLLFDYGLAIILPADLFASGKESPEMLVVRPAGGEDAQALIAERPSGPATGLKYLATTFRCEPQQHGVIRHAPKNIKELHDFVVATGLDLLGQLRLRLAAWRTPDLLTARLIIVIAFPKTRVEDASVETTDLWAFVTTKTVREIGEALGCWVIQDATVCPLIGEPDPQANGASITLTVMSPHYAFSRSMAAHMNGLDNADDRKGVVIGAGALGSQVLTNLARAGQGRWTIVDEDLLLPHNLARHALNGFYVGERKASALATHLNSLFNDEERFVSLNLNVDVLHPRAARDAIERALREADRIVDMSASVPVARHLAIDVQSNARRVSLFLNPAGTDLVSIVEDADRKLRLDALEMQYYRAVLRRPELEHHLRHPSARFRYGMSCRDLTSRISQDRVALLSAVASAGLTPALASPQATIRVWQSSPEMELRRTNIRPAHVILARYGPWTLVTDAAFIERVRGLRRAKLPNETGGVLLGSFDLLRQIVYVVDTIPSPPDSKEWPTLYIRGHEKLPEMVELAGIRTARNLEYVGEWHSHPEGHRAHPSDDDMKVFTWLTELMNLDGRPALMQIVADREHAFYLGEMKRQGND